MLPLFCGCSFRSETPHLVDLPHHLQRAQRVRKVPVRRRGRRPARHRARPVVPAPRRLWRRRVLRRGVLCPGDDADGLTRAAQGAQGRLLPHERVDGGHLVEHELPRVPHEGVLPRHCFRGDDQPYLGLPDSSE